jgi:hypothetical protein|tara:strand:+ start:686 stop:934 length:249 start_codon:yes stop_codon:yes gene_type:complete
MEGTVKEAILSHESLEGFIASEDTPIDAKERVSTFFPVTPEESSTPEATKTVTNSSVRKQLAFTPLKPLKPPEPPGSSSKGS